MTLTTTERERAQVAKALETLVTEANRSHEAFIAASKQTGAAILAAANAARRTGIQLLSIKEQTPHGQWQRLFRTAQGRANPTHVLDFDVNTALRYMAIARALPREVTKLPDAVRSISDLLVAIGVKPEPCRVEQQKRHDPLGPFTRAESHANDGWAIVQKEIEKAEPEAWPEQVRLHFAQVIRPYAELYQRLIGTAGAKN